MMEQKARLRVCNLPEDACVLDLFCGNGHMYELAYKSRVFEYHGVDRKKIHNPDICTLMDNNKFIDRHDISKYNVFDLDDYGCPWSLLYVILRKSRQRMLTVFLTDGLVTQQKLGGKVAKWVSATERLPAKMNIPGINRFYEDIFATMLLDVAKRFEWTSENACFFHNDRRTVYYWCLLFKNADPENKLKKY